MKHISIIGGGIAGLSAGLILQHKGYNVTILDKLDRVGGLARGILHGGHLFESGPVVITIPDLIRDVYKRSGLDFDQEVEVYSSQGYNDIYYRGEEKFRFYDNKEDLRSEVRQKFPSEVDNFDRFFSRLNILYNLLFDQDETDFKVSITNFLSKLPEIIKYKMYKNAFWLSNHFFDNKYLQQIFSYKVLTVGNPLTTTQFYTALVYSLNDKGLFIKGGMHKFVDNMKSNFIEKGGVIRTNSEVHQIIHSDNLVTGVQLTCGETVNSDFIISGIDPKLTNNLLGRKIPTWDKILHRRYSHSFFVVYFTTNREYPEIAHQNHIFSGSYSELLRDIKNNDNSYLSDNFILFLYSPKRLDKGRIEKGKDVFYAVTAVPNTKSPIQWDNVKSIFETKILEQVEKLLPGLSKTLETKVSLTPKDFENDINSIYGNIFGLEPTFFQSGPFRYKNHDRNFSNLFYVGSNTSSGSGIVGVTLSALRTAGKILEMDNIQF